MSPNTKSTTATTTSRQHLQDAYHNQARLRSTKYTATIMILVGMIIATIGVVTELQVDAFLPSLQTPMRQQRRHTMIARVTSSTSEMSSNDIMALNLTNKEISQMTFRELQRHVRILMGSHEYNQHHTNIKDPSDLTRGMTTSALREKIRSLSNLCIIRDDGVVDCTVEEDDDDNEKMAFQKYIDFVDISNPTQELVTDIKVKCQQNHWKSATRKLKKLTRQLKSSNNVEQMYEILTEDLLVQVLTACAEKRLQGARASESCRKVMEQLVELGYTIPMEIGNYCIQNTLDETSSNSTHQGFGGIDTALAMLAAMEKCQTTIQPETYEKLIFALAKEGSISSALAFLREQVIDHAVVPPLATFAKLSQIIVSNTVTPPPSPVPNSGASNTTTTEVSDPVFTLLAYSKAAGYDIDNISAEQDGRTLLASGIIAAERSNNDIMGFRLLKAASNALNLGSDRGDTMVAMSSSAAQRACTLIHKRAINKAVIDGDWQLSVKVLELMVQRSLKPSPWVWRNVIACCAKAQKSKKATGLLLDWVKLHEQGKVDRPPLSVFNTCVNVCEICNEQDLTVVVLDTMKKTHDTDGNLITFNIALKRLAKLGNYPGCEGIIVGMLQAETEPSVVSYTTAIAACVSSEVRQPKIAYEWLRRMRSRNVQPNVITYNTALAACLDGTMEGTNLASKIALEMLADVDKQLVHDADTTTTNYELDEYRNVIPDASTKVVARKLMEQLKQNWIDGHITKAVATETVRVPLLRLVDFQKSEAAERARQQELLRQQSMKLSDDQSLVTKRIEIEIESLAHRVAEV